MIEEVISDYLPLQRKGRNFLGKCPFHDDKTPSLTVSPQKEIFKCFSCGAGGDVINFICKMENKTFIEAKQMLFEKYKLTDFKPTIERKPPVNQSQRKKLLAINQDTLNFYHYQFRLNNCEIAKAYLANRNIDRNQIDKFELGYAPYRDELYHFLKQKGHQEQDLLLAGVVRKKDDNTITDVFKQRIIIPIKNHKNEVVAFSGRAINKENQIKYLNTAETPIFEKSKILYNLNQTAKGKTIFVVEGYFDAIALNKINIPAVALMGTSLSAYQEKLLINHSKNIKVLLDNDLPGNQAAINISKQLKNYSNLDLMIINNPTKYKDADELVNNVASEKLQRALGYQPQQTLDQSKII